MHWALVLFVVAYLVYRVKNAPGKQKELSEWQRDRDFDNVMDRIADATHTSFSSPHDGGGGNTSCSADFSRMELEESSYHDDYHGETTWELHRAANGEWFQRTVGARKTYGSEDIEADARKEAEGRAESREDHSIEQDDAMVAAEASYCLAAVREWTTCFPTQLAWLESSYTRCVQYFRDNPGLFPGMTPEVYAKRQFDPSTVWQPPARVTVREFEASRERLSEAKASLSGHYDRAEVPEPFRVRRGYVCGVTGE